MAEQRVEMGGMVGMKVEEWVGMAGMMVEKSAETAEEQVGMAGMMV